MDAARSNTGGHSENSQINGTLRVQPNDQLPMDNTGYSQLSSPSTRSISPSRYVISNINYRARATCDFIFILYVSSVKEGLCNFRILYLS